MPESWLGSPNAPFRNRPRERRGGEHRAGGPSVRRRSPSWGRRAAVRAETRARGELLAALRAELRTRDDRGRAALRAELRARRQRRLTLRTERAHRRDLALHVDGAPHLVGLALLRPRLFDGDLRLNVRGLFADVGRAIFAEPALMIPANLGTYPLPATRALLELRPAFLDGL